MIKKMLKSKKAEGYIDVVVGVIALVLFLLVALSVFSFITLRIQMDRIAEELIETATYSGSFGSNFEEKVAELQGKYFDFDLEYTADEWFSYEKKQVQLGTPMTVTITVEKALFGSSVIIPIKLKVHAVGQSEQYWRIDQPEYDTGHNENVVKQTKYVLDHENSIFHLTQCSLVGSIPEGMATYTNMIYDDIRAMGFSACTTCGPHACEPVTEAEFYSMSHHWGVCTCGEIAGYEQHLWDYNPDDGLYYCTGCPAVDNNVKQYCESCGETLYPIKHNCP